MWQYSNALTDYRRHSKADHEAPTCWHLSTLAMSGIRNEMSMISMDSNEGDDCWWTYKGPAQAEVLKLCQYNQNGGYQRMAS